MKLRAAAPVVFTLALGCTDDLLPGESILGVDRSVEVVYGGELSALGSSVAWSGTSWAAAAPGSGEVWVDGEVTPTGDAPPASAAFVGWMGEALVRAGPGGGALDGEVLVGLEGDLFAASSGGIFVGDGDYLSVYSEEPRAVLPGLQALAAEGDDALALGCEADCEYVWWTSEGVLGVPLAAGIAGPGGVIAVDHSNFCFGNPQLDDPDGAGTVTCTDGRSIEGEPGDHLGSAIGGGYAAGTFNKWAVPPRVRIVPLDGGEILVLEEGAENQPITLAGDDSTLIIGAPFHPHGGAPSGAVFIVSK